jgi:hypothetical protein
MTNPQQPIHPQQLIMATSVTAISLGNAIVIAMTETLVARGILPPREAQKMVLEIVDLVKRGTDNSGSIFVADQLCNDLEQVAATFGAR